MASQSTHSRNPSDAPTDPPPSLQTPAEDPLTRDYIASILQNSHQTLSSSATRANFITTVLGDDQLATDAEDDLPLLSQLEARATELVSQCARLVPNADPYTCDIIAALFVVLASRWSILLDAIERAGATLVIVAVMQRWRSKPHVVARALAALRAFTITDAMRRRVMFDGGMDLTLQLMSQYTKDHHVQDRSIAVIANVAFGCTHRKRRIARQGAVTKVIHSMTAFPMDDNIQLRGALAIRNLTYDAQVNQYIAGNEGAVEAIASTLLRFRGNSINPDLRFQCVLALESLCKEDERNRQRLADIDNLATTSLESRSSPIESMPKLEIEVEEEDETLNEDGDVIVDEEQVLVADVTAKFRHGDALCPGGSSLKVMLSPSASSSGCSDRTTPSLVLDESKLIIGHDSKPEKKDDLGQCESKQKRSIVRAIVHAIRRDPDDDHLLETGISLLTLVSLNRGSMQLRVGELGGIHVAIAAIRRHPKSPSLVAKACALIRCLCLQEANRGQVTSGLPVLVATAKEYIKNADVVSEVASALSNSIFEHEKNRAWVINKGGIEVMVSAINDCGRNDVMVLEAGICALRNFIDSSYSGAVSAANEGAVKAAVTALDYTKDASTTGEQIVQEQAILFLVDVARLAPQTTEQMMSIDAADWIENALAKLPIQSYPELHSAGDKLIEVLTDNNQQTLGPGGKGERESPPSPNGISGKPFSRIVLGGFSLPRWTVNKDCTQRRRRQAGWRSTLLNSSNGSGPARKRLSARFSKSSTLS